MNDLSHLKFALKPIQSLVSIEYSSKAFMKDRALIERQQEEINKEQLARVCQTTQKIQAMQK